MTRRKGIRGMAHNAYSSYSFGTYGSNCSASSFFTMRACKLLCPWEEAQNEPPRDDAQVEDAIDDGLRTIARFDVLRERRVFSASPSSAAVMTGSLLRLSPSHIAGSAGLIVRLSRVTGPVVVLVLYLLQRGRHKFLGLARSY